MLFQGKDKLFHHIFEELIVVSSGSFRLFNPSINREQSCLVEFLRLHQSSDPVFLPLLEILNDFLLVHQMFFVFTKVLSTNILDLI